MATALADLGLRRQDRIAVLGTNSLEFAEVPAAGQMRTGSTDRVLLCVPLFYLVDRKKDVIVSGGENVYSQQVEDAVITHPAVGACAVIGVPDERWGEAVCVVVVPTGAGEVTLAGLQEHVRVQLARHKAPRALHVVDALPTLPTGKVDKKRLRTLFASGAASSPAP
ncbi:class I adenylate-forming enzyme family protein [Cryptosporangium aurantiacum]|uniref:AMP-binding enzyme C-terminal domain-containing protein n=1 Tax=Cryptosporangium aurantiacum TaxID=134849 RepID=A0A1M7PH10_9ACTN|nr:hypothetical protein [Cryptosporangium aurantiacum]SHN16352.1 AMP-binding enzyme C-terminal domain-containing protein [Cryptosporangium aurantiacum]